MQTESRLRHALPRLDAGGPALLDAIPDAAAVLDGDGTIVAVNTAWRMFTLDNGGSPDATGVGVNYLSVCDRSAAAGCADARLVADGLRSVLHGETVECDLDYPCPSPSVGRWFVLRITPIADPQLGALVSHVNISRRKMAEHDLERRASEDPLTGLANRTLFTQRLVVALAPRADHAPNAGVGLLYVDLDGFKGINDTYGHAAGDEVLQTVASRLSQVARPRDTVARLGGDEFAMIFPRMTSDGMDRVVDRLEGALDLPHLVHGRQLHVGASVGTYLAAVGEDAVAALGHADTQMYAVKANRKRRA